MKLLDPAPTPADLDSRGFTAIPQALLSAVLCIVCVGSVIAAVGWVTGTTSEPGEVTLPGRGGPDTLEYAPDTGWFILLAGLVFGLLFAVVTVTLIRRAVSAFRRTSKEGRLAEQRERHTKRNQKKKGSAGRLSKRAGRCPDALRRT